MDLDNVKDYLSPYWRRLREYLPNRTVIIVYILLLFVTMAIIMVSSFLPKMIKSYGKGDKEIGYFAASVTSSLYFGQILCLYAWRYVTRSKGKKMTLILSGCGLSLTTLAFGLSNNYYWALFTRFSQGCFLASSLIYRSILKDVCQEYGISFMYSDFASLYLIAGICAPLIGGFLVFPADKYPELYTKDKFPGNFPILLPMLILAVGIMISVLLTIAYLPNDVIIEETVPLLSGNNNDVKKYGGSGESIILKSGDSNKAVFQNGKQQNNNLQVNTPQHHQRRRSSTNPSPQRRRRRRKSIVKQNEHIIEGVVYGMFSFVAKGFTEIFPVFAATDLNLHGLGFLPSEIATILLLSSLVATILQYTIMNRLINYYDPKLILIIFSLGLVFLFPCLPPIVAFSKAGLLIDNFVIFCEILITRVLTYNIYLVLDDIVKSSNRISEDTFSYINIIGETLGPVVISSVYAMSLSNVVGGDGNDDSALGFPFNQYLTFFIQSLCALLIAFLAALLLKQGRKRGDTFRKESRGLSVDSGVSVGVPIHVNNASPPPANNNNNDSKQFKKVTVSNLDFSC